MLGVDATYFTNYLKQKGLSEQTIKEYRYYFLGFEPYLFNQDGLRQFFNEPKNNNVVARAFIRAFKECLLVNYKALHINNEQYKEINEVIVPKQTGRKEQKITIPLNLEQIKRLEEHLATQELKLMLNLTYYCGLRLGELISIKINSFNWEVWKNNPDEFGEVIVYGKGRKEAVSIVPSWLMKEILIYINLNPKKFIKEESNSKLFKITGDTWEERISKAGISSKITMIDSITGKPIENTRVYPHRLRHSYASNLLKGGVDIRFIKEALRHTSISSTQIYTYVSKDDLKQKLQFINEARR
jgi:integrase/recombinase XerD